MKECKSTSLVSGKWLVASSYSYIEGYGNIQKLNGLARGDESCGNGVFCNEGISEGRNLRFDESDSQGSSICSEQYSGREWQNEQQGLCSSPLDSQWFIEGTGNTDINIGKDRLFEQRKMRGTNKAIWFGGSFVDCIKKIARKVTTSHLPLATSQTSKFKFHNGFGLIEVLAAAIVLGFLLVGLNLLQKGNRESVLRVRARDAANIIAQYVLDSLGSVGINALGEAPIIIEEDTARYTFEGKAGKIEMPFYVHVENLPIIDADDFIDSEISDDTYFAKADGKKFAKRIEITVSWDFKKSKQSIKMRKVVR
jgi:type II secretory pathway pseudopilin PulG